MRSRQSNTPLRCLLPVSAALVMTSCATTGSPGPSPGSSGSIPVPPQSPVVVEAPTEDEVTYVTEVDRIPQRDGSVIVVTTVRGSDGTVYMDEERIWPNGRPKGATRGISEPGAAEQDAREAARRQAEAQAEAERQARSAAEMEAEIRAEREAQAAAEEEALAEADLGDFSAEEIIAAGPDVSDVRCDPAALEFDFDWPPPEPSARIEIPRRLLLGGLIEPTPPVSTIQSRVENALSNAGYIDQAFYTIGCDGFAIITRMEQIDRNGRPVDEGLRFTSPSEGESWSLTGYLTRLFYAPPGFYRQIILAGTDEVYSEDDLQAAPDEDQLEQLFTAGSAQALDIDRSEVWSNGHKLHALVYEFETEGTRNVKQRRPSSISAERHVEAAGIYGDLD